MVLNNNPGTFAYIIQPGDTFWDLAEEYDVDIKSIFDFNPGIDPDNLVVGQVIALPGDPPSSQGPRFGRRRAALERRRRLELERRRREELKRRRRRF